MFEESEEIIANLSIVVVPAEIPTRHLPNTRPEANFVGHLLQSVSHHKQVQSNALISRLKDVSNEN